MEALKQVTGSNRSTSQSVPFSSGPAASGRQAPLLRTVTPVDQFQNEAVARSQHIGPPRALPKPAELSLVQRTISVVRALGMSAAKALTFADLKQLYDFAKLSVSSGYPKTVLDSTVDVLGFVLKYPEDAQRLLAAVGETPMNTWDQKSAWMGGKLESVKTVGDPIVEPSPRQMIDTVVIGGGVTAASVAHNFAEAFAKGAEQRQVTILERDPEHSRVHAASVRNAGMICTVTDYLFGIDEAVGDKPIERIAEALEVSRPEAERVFASLVEVLKSATDRVMTMLKDRGVSVDLHREGGIDIATTAKDLAQFRWAVGKAKELGLDWKIIDKDVMGEKYGIAGKDIHGGVMFPGYAALNPAKLVQTLFKRARKSSAYVNVQHGVKVLQSYKPKDGKGWIIVTNQGVIRAKNVIDTREGFAKYSFRKAHYSQIHVLRVPPDVGPMQMSFTSVNHGLAYMRKISAGRFLVGSGDFPVKDLDNPVRPLGSVALYAGAMFKKIYPDVPIDVERVWGGVFGMSTDDLPTVGELAKGWHVLGGAGGTGLSYCTAMAKQTVDDILRTPGRQRSAARLGPENAFSPRRFFVKELRHDLARTFEALPKAQRLIGENIRVEWTDATDAKSLRPRREGALTVFTISTADLDALNPDAQSLMGAEGATSIQAREALKASWLNRQLAHVAADDVDVVTGAKADVAA